MTSPLSVGQKYFVNLKVNCSFNFPVAGNNTATNKFGFLFSTVDFLSSPPPINNFSHIYTDSIIDDTLNWTTIKGSFIADSAYTFISLGNFFDNANTDTLQLDSSNSYQAYVYVDDVCVSDDSLFSEVWANLPENVKSGNIVCYPNPATNKLILDNIPYDCQKINIFNSEGRLVKSKSLVNEYKLQFDLTDFACGIYSLVFITEKNIQVKNIIKAKGCYQGK